MLVNACVAISCDGGFSSEEKSVFWDLGKLETLDLDSLAACIFAEAFLVSSR